MRQVRWRVWGIRLALWALIAALTIFSVVAFLLFVSEQLAAETAMPCSSTMARC